MGKQERRKKYKIIIRNKAQKNLLKIPFPWKLRIAKAIDLLEDDPFLGEKMWGRFKNCFKIRIWPYRIVYEVIKNKRLIYIRRIDHRGRAYKN